MHWIDYIIVIFSIAAAIVVGMYFAHKQKDTSQYFAGGGKIPAWAVGISIFATLISSVTFLAYPGAAYADNWILLVQGLMVPIVLLALVGIIVPLFRKVIRLSTYEYFERRFGLFARLYSSFAFTLGHFSKAPSRWATSRRPARCSSWCRWHWRHSLTSTSTRLCLCWVSRLSC